VERAAGASCGGCGLAVPAPRVQPDACRRRWRRRLSAGHPHARRLPSRYAPPAHSRDPGAGRTRSSSSNSSISSSSIRVSGWGWLGLRVVASRRLRPGQATDALSLPAGATRPPLRSTHSASELGTSGSGGGGGSYTMDQLNASAAGKDQFFARKMHENASRYVGLRVRSGHARR